MPSEFVMIASILSEKKYENNLELVGATKFKHWFCTAIGGVIIQSVYTIVKFNYHKKTIKPMAVHR